MRNLICTGGALERVAFLDNFCWGNPEDKQELAGIVRAGKACYDASLVYEIPFVSGKDSLNNTYLDKTGKLRSIPSSLLISAIGVVKDIRKCLTMNFKKSGNVIYLVGETKAEMGGSIFNVLNKIEDTNIPKVDLEKSKNTMDAMNKIIDEELLCAIHDLSEGGLAVSLAEMCFAGGLGADVEIAFENSLIALFAESCSRFVIEVEHQNIKKFETMLNDKNVKFTKIGEVTNNETLVIKNSGKVLIEQNIKNLEHAFKNANWE